MNVNIVSGFTDVPDSQTDNVPSCIRSSSDLGAHIDGFCAVVAHTFVVGASKVTVRILHVSSYQCMSFRN